MWMWMMMMMMVIMRMTELAPFHSSEAHRSTAFLDHGHRYFHAGIRLRLCLCLCTCTTSIPTVAITAAAVTATPTKSQPQPLNSLFLRDPRRQRLHELQHRVEAAYGTLVHERRHDGPALELPPPKRAAIQIVIGVLVVVVAVVMALALALVLVFVVVVVAVAGDSSNRTTMLAAATSGCIVTSTVAGVAVVAHSAGP
jgi:hypothetical protein